MCILQRAHFVLDRLTAPDHDAFSAPGAGEPFSALVFSSRSPFSRLTYPLTERAAHRRKVLFPPPYFFGESCDRRWGSERLPPLFCFRAREVRNFLCKPLVCGHPARCSWWACTARWRTPLLQFRGIGGRAQRFRASISGLVLWPGCHPGDPLPGRTADGASFPIRSKSAKNFPQFG